jgi:hypothetical protein
LAKVFLPARKILARLVSVATPVRRPTLVDPSRAVLNSAANCDVISQGDVVQSIVWFCNFGVCSSTRLLLLLLLLIIIIITGDSVHRKGTAEGLAWKN